MEIFYFSYSNKKGGGNDGPDNQENEREGIRKLAEHHKVGQK